PAVAFIKPLTAPIIISPRSSRAFRTLILNKRADVQTTKRIPTKKLTITIGAPFKNIIAGNEIRTLGTANLQRGFHATSLYVSIVIRRLVIALFRTIRVTPSKGPTIGTSIGSATRENPIPETRCTAAANMKMRTTSTAEHTSNSSRRCVKHVAANILLNWLDNKSRPSSLDDH